MDFNVIGIAGGLVTTMWIFFKGTVYVFAKNWFNNHKEDIAAMMKLLEEFYSDGILTTLEKITIKDEIIKRFLLKDLPWYIPKKLVIFMINKFIDNAILKAKEQKQNVQAEINKLLEVKKEGIIPTTK